MSDDRLSIDSELVRELIADQFPHWADLEIRQVTANGWDNSTFHLGSEMKIRMPTAVRYIQQVEKERRYLPHLQAHLPYELPKPIAVGEPGHGYPFPWSIQSFIPGETITSPDAPDKRQLAAEIADFLRALHRVPAEDGPPPGTHNFFRGGSPSFYDSEVQTCLAKLGGVIDPVGALSVWGMALASSWKRPQVWLHGDVSPGNLLLRNGKLAAVIDFGCSGVGDPACDLMMAWTFFAGERREIFRDRVGLDLNTWARARGWALWKALLKLSDGRSDEIDRRDAMDVISALIDEVKQNA
ncbi:aminoglycoside phosphotransferase family protein [Rhizobium oryzicola]|uniref:Aminoglycoside phosphotransferase family protein n=1 Tax=Rhizobium oryzicola TaxID=1232668 RepID=A0ABT8SSN4_9HYPH|nr:aminoglycoside phosphotransferase family protein [Rhizobium oryzicola]MDO1581425.1 aminoglycoside phosphotransferase family protein [Rhizobium oryzicola]